MLLQPSEPLNPKLAMDDSVAMIDKLLTEPKSEMRDHMLRANAEHLLIMTEKLGIDEGYIAKANEALAVL